MQILLVQKASGKNHSIEAGLSDGYKNFDHHNEHKNNPAPCNDPRISTLKDNNDIVEITHADADTLIGLMRLLGFDLPRINMSEIEKIDLNGSSSVSSDSDELAFCVGIDDLVQKASLPRHTSEPQDVTQKVTNILTQMQDGVSIINIGKENMRRSENDYKQATFYVSGKVKCIYCSTDAQIDPSRAYKDDYDVVVFYREQYKSISLYANPKSNIDFMKNPNHAGITFAGHSKACGSPRGTEFEWKDAVAVAQDIYNKINEKSEK